MTIDITAASISALCSSISWSGSFSISGGDTWTNSAGESNNYSFSCTLQLH